MKTAAIACVGFGFAAASILTCAALPGDGGQGGTHGNKTGSTGAAGFGGAVPTGTAEVADLGVNPTDTGSSTGSNTGPPSTGPGVGPGFCIEASAELIGKAPSGTRTVDSAVYARAALRKHLAPDPNLLRLDDFLNFYGSPASYADAPTTGEIEYLEPEGIIEARFRIPTEQAHKSRGFLVLVDTSLSMQTRFALQRSVVQAFANHVDEANGDRLDVLGWSGDLTTIFDQNSSQSLDDALTTAFASPGAASDLDQVLPKALTIAESLDVQERHVVLLTDGGSGTNNLDFVATHFAEKGVDLDVALLALAGELADKKTGRAVTYNQALLTKLTPADGARLFVTDSVSPGGASDVDSLLTSRFDEFFGAAIEAPRAIFIIPSVLKLAVADPASVADGMTALVSRGVGFDRMLTFQVRVEKSPDFVQLNAGCSAAILSASLDGIPGGASPTIVAGDIFMPSTPLGMTRMAIQAYVAALRTLHFPEATAAIGAAQQATCSSAKNPLCLVNQELSELLMMHPDFTP